MRYLAEVAGAMLPFLLFAILGALGVSPIGPSVVAGLGAVLGLLLDHYVAVILLRQLLHGASHFTTRRAPGGVWFLVGIGLLSGVCAAAFVTMGPANQYLLRRDSSRSRRPPGAASPSVLSGSRRLTANRSYCRSYWGQVASSFKMTRSGPMHRYFKASRAPPGRR